MGGDVDTGVDAAGNAADNNALPLRLAPAIYEAMLVLIAVLIVWNETAKDDSPTVPEDNESVGRESTGGFGTSTGMPDPDDEQAAKNSKKMPTKELEKAAKKRL